MLTTMDAETERHLQTWIGFCRFMKIMVVVIVLILLGMAIFLL
jgi:Bacterial aa3 type cytochrome c oxidase subunit IV